jgi:O-antigen/teichoic acid export membrane protein
VLRQFLKDSAIYGAASILVRSVSLVLVPLYTRVLAPEDYGVVDILTALTGFVAVTVSLEISQAVARFFTDSDDPNERQGYASTSFWFSFCAYSAFLAVAAFLAAPLSVGLLGVDGLAGVFRVAAAATWLSGLFYLVQSQLRYSLRPVQFAIASLVFSFVSIGVSAILVLYLRQGVVGVFAGQVVGGVSGLVVALVLSRDVYRFRFDRDKLAEMLRFSLPLVPSSVAVIVTLYVDRIAINELMTLRDVGLFGVGYRLSSLTALLMVGFVGAPTPLIYAHYREPGTPGELARIFRLFTALALLTCLGLALFARDVLAVVTTPDYVPGAVVVPLLAPALLLASMYIFAPGLGIARRTRQIAAINIAAAILNTILNFALVPILGIVGAATATLLSSASLFGANMVASQRLYPVPHDWPRLALAVIASVALFGIGETLQVSGLAGIGLRVALLFAATVAFVIIGLVDQSDVARTVHGIRPRRSAGPSRSDKE